MKHIYINENKVWIIETKGKSFTTAYGDVYNATHGTLRRTTKTFDSEVTCEKEKEKIIKSKCKKGYEELSVNIEGVPLDELAEIHNIKKGLIKKLRASYNNETHPELIEETLNLSHLEELSTSSPILIKQIDRLTALSKLTISGEDAITAIPETIINLKNLKYLEIESAYDPITLSEHIGKISTLKELHLYSLQKLNKIPQSIGKLISLEVLDIRHCKGGYLEKKGLIIPESLGQLVHLKKLEISNCNLKEVAAYIGNLTSLEALDLSNNQLKDLPESIGDLQKLTQLEIDYNHFESIPEGVCKLRNLVDLDISSNPLQKIDANFLQLTALKELNFDYDKITNIPENILTTGFNAIKDFLKNGPTPKLSIKIAPIPEHAEQLVNERKEQVKGIIYDIRKELYEEFEQLKFDQILAFIFGETNKLPNGRRSEIYDFESISDIFNPIYKWSFIDRRLLAFICNDTFIFKEDCYYSGYYSRFFKYWFLPQLKQEQEGEDFFGQLIEELKSCQIDEWTALTGYLDETRKESFLRHDGSTNSIGKVILKYLQTDRKKIMNLLEKEYYTKPLIPLLATKRDILNELLDELLPYYDTSEAQRHIYYTKLEELCKIDNKAYESLVLEQMKGSDCLSCIMECYRILLTYVGDTYKTAAIKHAKIVLVDITTRKNENRKYKFNWSGSTEYLNDDTPEFIQWLCIHLGEDVKAELFNYVKDTKMLDIDIISALVQRFGQDAITVAIEALKMSTKDISLVPHYRQAFTLLEDLDYSAYYDQVWKVACSPHPDLADLACVSLANRPATDIFNKAVSFLSSKKKAERRAGVFILSQLGSAEAIETLEPILDNEKIDEIRNLAIGAYYKRFGQKEVTIPNMKAQIANADKRGKLEKPVAKWIDTLPRLTWNDGKQLTKKEQYYLFYRQSCSSSITPDIEAIPMYTLLDKAQAADVAFKTFQYINKNIGFKAASKMAFALMGILGDQRLVELSKDVAINNKNANVCTILGMLGTQEAAFALDQIIQHFEIKYPNVRRAAEQAFEDIALHLELTHFELKDKMLPDFGFVNKERPLDVGTGYTLSISPQLKFTYTNTQGKQVKSIPKPPAPIKNMLKDMNANLRRVVKQYTLSLEHYLVTQRLWPGDDWKHHFIEHPVAFAFSQSLVWQTNRNKTFIVLPNGDLQDETGNTISIKDNDRIQLAHPLNLVDSIKSHWESHLKEANIQQAIQQLDRALVAPTPEELEVLQSRTFESNSLNAGTFKYRAHKKGWRRGSIGDGGGIVSYTKAFKEAGIDVFIETQNIAVYAELDDEDVVLGKCYFTPFGSVQVNGGWWNSEPGRKDDERLMAIKNVPLLVFSEAMKDLKEITKTK